MSLVGSSSKSIKKTDLINQKQLAVGFKKTIVYHEATLGDSTINLNSLTMPTSLSSLGFIQATPSEVQSAQIKTYHKNVTITSSARGLLIEGLSYTITSSTVITFTSDFGTALAGEIFIITVDMNARSGFIGVDAVPIIVTGTLLAGSDTFNVGSQFRVNYNPAQQIGEIIVLMNGVAQFRNVGNATAAPAADGNYQELDAGGGWGTQIKFNAADTIDQPIMVLSSGLRVVRPDGSLVQELENINGTIQQLVSVTAALSGLPTNYFNSPSFPDLKAFGDRVYNLESAAMNISGLKTFNDGLSSVEYVGTNPEVGGSSPFQLTNDHKRIQSINPAGAITIKLPTTGIKAGERFRIENRSVNEVTVQSSDTTQIDIIALGFIELRSLVNTPTGLPDWKILDYYSEGTTATTWTFNGSGGTSASSDVKYVRKLNTIFLQVPQALATTGTSSTTLTSNIGVPIWARSSVSQRFGGVLVGENGSRLATQGMIDFNTNGTFTIYRGSNTPINWTNATVNSGHVSGNPVVFIILK